LEPFVAAYRLSFFDWPNDAADARVFARVELPGSLGRGGQGEDMKLRDQVFDDYLLAGEQKSSSRSRPNLAFNDIGSDRAAVAVRRSKAARSVDANVAVLQG